MSQVQGTADVPVPFKRVLVANRADVAVRVFGTCRALGITAIGVAPADDADALHTRHCDELVTLPGSGPAAYLDVDELLSAAVRSGAEALHPGWGFRAESPELARACYEQGVVFLGPSAQALALLGDKARARRLARTCGIPVVPGTDEATELLAVRRFWDEQVAQDGPDIAVAVKARSGGGGRGIRVVTSKPELDAAFRQATAESQSAFGSAAVYVERYLTGVHHVEVQVVGDSQGRVRHLWDRECSIQRQHQKLLEVAPSPVLGEHARSRMLQAAARLGAAAGLTGVATVEFLATSDDEFWFLECNPRLQVEHTVTEAVLGLDLVQLQLQMAAGVTLSDLGIEAGRGPVPRGAAVQVRLNAERIQPDGTIRPSSGTVEVLDLPSGWGVRVDPAVARGAAVNPRYDSLVAKVVCHGPDLPAAMRLAAGALEATRIDGVSTNLAVQRAVLAHPDVLSGRADTGWFERSAAELLALAGEPVDSAPDAASDGQAPEQAGPNTPTPDAFEQFRAEALGGQPAPTRRDPGAQDPDARAVLPDGAALAAPVSGLVVAVLVRPGEEVEAGTDLILVEAMKMQHPVAAPVRGRVGAVGVAVGDQVVEGQPVAHVELVGGSAPASDAVRPPATESTSGGGPDLPASTRPMSLPSADPHALSVPSAPASAASTVAASVSSPTPSSDGPPSSASPAPHSGRDPGSGRVRADLQTARDAHAPLWDVNRPDAVAARRSAGRRTARENVDAVTDAGLEVEFGGLAVAAQRRKRELRELVERTPADGIITGLGRVNGALFPPERSTVAVAAYDYTVMAGTQGVHSHQKLDRLLDVAREGSHPLILFAEGGGGRPNDTDVPVVAGLHVTSFAALGRLSGTVPLIGIAAGSCFAGNAALLGTCDVVIATRDSSIGMGGPAMIAGGGLGEVPAADVGPIEVQRANGVVDVAVADESEAAEVARRYLGYFQGALPTWTAPDPVALRDVVPEDRKRVYDVRSAIAGIADVDSVLELRAGFGAAAVTALARIEGRPVGVIANQPVVNSGAIDVPAADKLARFLQLCDAFGLPVLSLCDTPGFMVGPEAEKQAGARHFPRLFVRGANLSVPLVTVVLRKAYGLGAMAMAGGGFRGTAATLSWPSGEFGAMGLEGAVRLGHRRALAAIEDPEARRARYHELVARAYERGSAVNAARHLEVDDVIDPAHTRPAVIAALLSRPQPPRDAWANTARRDGIDTW